MTFSAVQRRDLWLLAVLRGVSFLGDSVALVTLYLRLAHFGHAWMIAALSIAAALPLVVLSPIAGIVIDHTPAKRLLSSLCVVEALVCVAIGYWHAPLTTIALMALLSCSVAFSFPGYSALVPKVAGEENINKANSIMQAVVGIASVAGPGLGGLLVGLVGQSWPLYFDAGSFVVAAFATLALVTDRRPEPGTVRPRKGERDFGAGRRILFGDPVLRPLVVTFLVFLLALIMVNVAEVFFITRTLHASALVYGSIGASFGVGNIAGSLASPLVKQQDMHLVRACIISVGFIGVLMGAVGLVEQVTWVFPLMIVIGVGVGVINVEFNTLMTVRTPEAQRGQMFSASNAVFTSAEIGATALGGVFLSLVAPRTLFQISGVASTMAVVILGPVALRAARRSTPPANDQGA